MPEESPSVNLKEILDDIADTQIPLQKSRELIDSLYTFSLNENGNASNREAKEILDQLRGNISSVYSCFCKYYNRSGKKVNNNHCENENSPIESEVVCADLVNSSNKDNSDNSVETTMDDDIRETMDPLDIINESQTNTHIGNGTEKEINADQESRCKDTEVNTVRIQSKTTDADQTQLEERDATTPNCDSNENNAPKEFDKDISNQRTVGIVLTADKGDLPNRAASPDDKESVGSGCNTTGEANSTKENGGALDDEAEKSDTPDINLVVVRENNCEKVNDDTNNGINEENNKDDDCDPLNIDGNLCDVIESKDSPSIPDKATDVVDDENYKRIEPKKEPTFKIKCVDIKKLMEKPNSSVVIISDSENEVSPLKKKRDKSKETENAISKLGGEITVTKVSSKEKKVIVLDDTDSSDNGSVSRKRTKVEPAKKRPIRETRRRNPVSQQSEQSSNVNSVSRSGRQLRTRRPIRNDLTNISSLSESSSSSSSERDSSIVAASSTSKKTRRKAPKQVNNDSALLSSLDDKKFSCKCYIPLTRISPERLKKNYDKKVLKDEIEKLTNLDNMKRSRRNRNDSSNSAGSDSSGKKEGHCTKRSRKSGKEAGDSDGSDASMHSNISVNKDDAFEALKDDVQSKEKDEETQIAEAMLNGVKPVENKSDSDDSKSSDKEENDKTEKVNEEAEQTTEKPQENAKKPASEKETKKSHNSDDSSDTEAKREKKKWRSDKLLTENITESDSDEDFAKFMKKKGEMKEKDSDVEEIAPKKSTKRLKKKKGKYVLGSSDSESAASDKDSSKASKKSSDSESSDSTDNKKEKPTRRRIKRIKDSSDDDENGDKSTRKNIRKVWARDSLSASTIAAEKEEQERKARIAEKQKKYNAIFEESSLEKSTVDKVVLDFDEETKKELLKVDKRIVKHLKPHQARGIKFMWDTCFESLDRAKETKGSGCILAHCMGLGKTLQVISLVHTLLKNQGKTGVRKVLIVCPLSTVLNWVAEFKKWLGDDDEDVEVFELVSFKQNVERACQVKEWDRVGGALILGYDMFRNLTNTTNKRLSKKMRNTFETCLVNPGPELVICDEGHLLKNEKTSTSIAMNRLQTMRRIVLTGTPLQNNLKEYFCMVQFVKPNLLGTYKEYLNRFVNPITNGQYTDSTQHDIDIMRKRSHVLHKLLDGVVQRRDYSVLAPFLPPKHEYVLFVSLTEMQKKLYKHYLSEKAGRKSDSDGRSKLFVDFNEFQRICTHLRVLSDKSNELKQARDKMDFLDDESEGSLKDFIDDGSDKSTTSTSNSSGSDSDNASDGSHKQKKTNNSTRKQRLTRATAAIYTISDKEESDVEMEPDPSEWWREHCTDADLDNIRHSGKLALLFEILRQCEIIGDKVLIFSQSLYSLNVIEYFLGKIDEATQNAENNSFCGFSGSWALGLDYFRLDGSSSCDNRAAWCKSFNNPENTRARLFLISTRAGGLGINLVAANRVVIFDVSWNPSHDTQSIYRVYRFGQNKPTYIYRFVTLGAMEMKIYERQVTKQAISKRVIDEQQIDRHYNQNDLAELYKFEPEPEDERPIPLVPKDVLLGELLQADGTIYKYHEHQSLLENKVDEVLDEEERKAAWEEFENEKKARAYSGTIAGYSVQSIMIALQSITKKENPDMDADAVVSKTDEMFETLQQEVQTGKSPLLHQAITEIQKLQLAQQQANMSQYYRMIQQQHALMNQYRMQMLSQQSMGQQRQRFNYPQMNNFRMPSGSYPRQRAPNEMTFARAMPDKPIDYVDLND